MNLPAIRARIEALEAQLAEAAASEAHNADTVWADALGHLNELRSRVLDALTFPFPEFPHEDDLP